MKKLKITFYLLFLLIHQNLIAQVPEPAKTTGISWSVFWNVSLNLESDRFDKNKLALNGFGVKMQKVFNSGVGIEVKSSFRSWSDFDKTVIPLTIGPSYTFSSSKNSTFLVRTGIGPHAVLGNDYAGIFAGFDIGPEVHINLVKKQALVLGLAFAQAMSFHPDSFEYLDMYVGWRF